jgi:hypothetical protein|tara:strand:+ start:3473 stop:4483 length:1011 start_codon:yes stop_codon:yes gene_type:complete
MAYQTGDTILDDHYNGFANTSGANLNKIWGVGDAGHGWGQGNAISTVSAGGTVQATQWNTLLDRAKVIADHEGGTMSTDSGSLAAGDVIVAIDTLTSEITTLNNNRYNAAASKLTAATNPNSVNRTFTGSWRTSTIQEVTVTFASSDAARYFFNAGGRITHSWSLSGNTANDKSAEWVDLFGTLAGTFFLAGVTDGLGGSGTQAVELNDGYWNDDLTNGGNYVVVQKQNADASAYTANFCQWEVKLSGTAGDNNGKGEVVHIKATASDAAVDSSDEGAAADPDDSSPDEEEDSQTLLDTVDGNLVSAWGYNKPNLNSLEQDAIGTITFAEAAQSQA